jgi:hypothetical protein
MDRYSFSPLTLSEQQVLLNSVTRRTAKAKTILTQLDVAKLRATTAESNLSSAERQNKALVITLSIVIPALVTALIVLLAAMLVYRRCINTRRTSTPHNMVDDSMEQQKSVAHTLAPTSKPPPAPSRGKPQGRPNAHWRRARSRNPVTPTTTVPSPTCITTSAPPSDTPPHQSPASPVTTESPPPDKFATPTTPAISSPPTSTAPPTYEDYELSRYLAQTRPSAFTQREPSLRRFPEKERYGPTTTLVYDMGDEVPYANDPEEAPDFGDSVVGEITDTQTTHTSTMTLSMRRSMLSKGRTTNT